MSVIPEVNSCQQDPSVPIDMDTVDDTEQCVNPEALINKKGYTTCEDAVIQQEHLYMAASRARAGVVHGEYTALAISGGGIRSASFGLGVLQALVSAGVLKKIDYLSTASGGGYIGSALTWLLHLPLPDGSQAGVEAHNFPLGKPGQGAKLPEPHTQNAALDYIRQHGNYLTPSTKLNRSALAALVCRCTLVSLVAYFSLLATLMLPLIYVGLFAPVASLSFLQSVSWALAPITLLINTPFEFATRNSFWLLALLSIVLFTLISFVFALAAGTGQFSESFRYRLRTQAQGLQGVLISTTLILLSVGSIPIIHEFLAQNIGQFTKHAQAGGASAALGAVMGLMRFVHAKRGKGGGLGSAVWVFVAAALVIFGLIYSAYHLAYALLFPQPRPVLIGLLAAFAGYLSFWVNINYLGLHRMYRDRLMEAFLPNKKVIKTNAWGMATEADCGLIEDMCQFPNERPYHIINTNIVLSDSDVAKYRTRGGDSFILSPAFSGSNASGWIKTARWLKSSCNSRVSKKSGMSLASAMAISGASVNPNAGNSGRGPTRSKLVSTLLTLLNIRLGYWVEHPNPKRAQISRPNFINPGLNGSFIGRGLTELASSLELTDGGHFDNLALYELIRRKVKLIILADAGADGGFAFDDLGNAVEKVRVDFGVKIRFDEEYSLINIQPQTAPDLAAVEKQYGLAKNAFALATIEYPDGSEDGQLIYIKATMIKHLPADIYSYRAAHPAFPHELTADQFFCESQMEAYRELGYQLTWATLENKNNGVTHGPKHWEPANNLRLLR